MESRFSGVVKLSNVSDFISASQDCVVASKINDDDASRIPKHSTQERVQISLQDCLACSGCVTSAETALLENQSSDEFLRKIADKEVTVAVTISSQARAALSVAFGMSPLRVGNAFACETLNASCSSCDVSSGSFVHWGSISSLI